MPKQTYVPTEADRLTGANVRALRRLAGETLQQTIDRSGVGISQSSLSNVELGKRQLSMPEATKLAAHFHTTTAHIVVRQAEVDATFAPTLNTVSPAVATEQEWLGNDKPTPPLFAVPDVNVDDLARALGHTLPPKKTITIDRDNPLTLDEYREQVWIPYLEARYSADLKAS
jgi:transcriptional regulator with XRE-family HTH domain